MAAGDSNFPAALDTDANLPDLTGYRQSGYLDTDGVTYDEHRHLPTWANTLRKAVLALEAKVGAGASVPSGTRILQAAEGGSAWVTFPEIPVTIFGADGGAALQVLRVKADETGAEWWTIPAGAAAATPALRALGTTATTAAAGDDERLSDTRTPSDGTVTDAKVAADAAIAESKLNLASDAAAGTPSRRTLGTGATQAAPGDHAGHIVAQAAIADLTATISNPPTQAEVADIQAKVNSILATLRAVGVIAT